MSHKIALLIDAENISHKHLPRILETVSQHGQLILRAVYGDWNQPSLQKWREIAEGQNFKLRHQTNHSKTKSSSDMKLIMDAMEILYRTQTTMFCLVTNDVDYVPLCDHLHEAKRYVVGIGSPQASEALIRTCDEFIFVGRDEASIQPPIESFISAPSELPPAPTTQPAPVQSANPPAFRKLLTKAFAQAEKDSEGWVGLSPLGQALREVHPDYKHTDYGYDTLSKVLLSVPDFVEFRNNATGGASARLKK